MLSEFNKNFIPIEKELFNCQNIQPSFDLHLIKERVVRKNVPKEGYFIIIIY